MCIRCLLVLCTVLCLVVYTYQQVVESADDVLCYDDVCVRSSEEVPRIWFNDRPDIFACPQPYATCDVGALAYEFCNVSMGLSGHDRAVCSHNLWRMLALKEQLILGSQYKKGAKLNTVDGTNVLGFIRNNDWFEYTVYMPGIISKQLIAPLGEEFLFAKPLRLLEIGSYEGGSATWYVRYMLSHPNSTLTCIDPWSVEIRNGLNSSLVWDTFNINIQATGRADRVRVIRSDSLVALARLVADGEQFDFIYVDGSHALVDVVADIALSWKLLAPGGVMALDDVPWRPRDLSTVMETKQYTYQPSAEAGQSAYPYCVTVGQQSAYSLENSIAALVTHLPVSDVLYCGYHMAVKKLY